MESLLNEISACTSCVPHLTLGPNPVLSVSKESKIIIIGQAPGAVVHKSGIPWEDKSGDTLRAWMGIEWKRFYNPKEVALIPMGFCYPGKEKSGDLPPRKECAPQWHPLLLSQLKNVKLILLVGKYAQDYYLQEDVKKILTERVKNHSDYLPKFFVLPHPSPRNNIWQARNVWFKKDVLPHLKFCIAEALL
jgi:uracil-DNA glycosylase